MTQGELFHKFIRNITPTKTELDRARRHRDYVTKILNNRELGIVNTRNYGSYAKGTSTHPLNDLDLIIYIDPDKYSNEKIDRVLHHIARQIRPSFPNNDIIVGNRSIKVRYANGFVVESGRWIHTSPSKHIEFTNAINRIDNRYKNLVRIFKIWKNNRRRNFRSFLLALLVADAIVNGDVPRGWPEAVIAIFKHIKDHGLNKKIFFTNHYQTPTNFPNDPVVVLDPVNVKNNVAEDVDSNKKREFLNAWEVDTRRASSTLNSANYIAVEKWKQIFGDVFPSRA